MTAARRRGRPRIEHPRSNPVVVRFNDDELAVLRNAAEDLGVSVAEVVRQSIQTLINTNTKEN